MLTELHDTTPVVAKAGHLLEQDLERISFKTKIVSRKKLIPKRYEARDYKFKSGQLRGPSRRNIYLSQRLGLLYIEDTSI